MVVVILILVLVVAAVTIIPEGPINYAPDSIINQPIEPLQIVSLIVIGGILFILYMEYLEDKKHWRWLMPMALWIIHGGIFYILLFADRYLNISIIQSYTNWSSVLRWHGYITIFLVEYFRWIWHRIKKGKSPDPIYSYISNLWNKLMRRNS